MPYLTEAMDSIINQTYTNLEILCINDGSTDDTAKVLEAYASKDSRVRVVHNEKNIKLIATLNKGIQLAKGEYIARMDSDDISVLNRLEIQINKLIQSPEIDLLGSSMILIDQNSKKIKNIKVRQTTSIATFFSSFFFSSIGHPDVIAKTNILKNNVFDTNKNNLHIEDYELWNRLAKKGYNLQNIPDFLLNYRVNPNGVSQTFSSLQDYNFISCVKKNIETFLDIELTVNSAKVISCRIDKDLYYDDIKKGFSVIEILYNYFVNNYNLNFLEKEEISSIKNTHTLDILIQLLKRGNLKVKLLSIKFLVKYFVKFINLKTIKYFFSKF